MASWQSLMKQAVEQLLTERVSINAEDPNFTRTPERVVRVFEELTTSLEEAQERVQQHLVVFPTDDDELVVVDGIASGMCPHHLLPVAYRYFVGYIPKKYAIGLSKIHRIFQEFARVPMLQEDLGGMVTKTLYEVLKPHGVGVVIRGQHSCMLARGVKQPDGYMITSSLKGIMQEPGVKKEFLDLVFHLLPVR